MNCGYIFVHEHGAMWMKGIHILTCMNILSASPMLPFSFKIIPCRSIREIKLELLGYGGPITYINYQANLDQSLGSLP